MAERISDKVSALLPRRENGRHNTDRRENSGKPSKSLQNRAFCVPSQPLLHYGNNGAKTFSLPQDLRCGMPVFVAGGLSGRQIRDRRIYCGQQAQFV
ncbi:hypothetical protein NKH99_16280 [Mesorhizobium sp. M0854]|uniref:hypothetical protein n=1 Tax=Mesorhizobium sp. M0854 TaxID=2957013 RepID=UPI003334BF3D